MDVLTARTRARGRDWLDRLLAGESALRGWSVALLVANIAIIVTGGVVRLTASGLGCPTWPRCTPGSFVTTPEMGVHGVIEFGNRLLTFALVIIALATVISTVVQARGSARRRTVGLAVIIAAGVPLQAVIGGISVLTGLNPYVVGLHLLLSMALVSLSVRLVRIAWGRVPRPVIGGAARLPQITFGLMAVAVTIGTVLTGSGPHAGARDVPRNGLNPELLSHVHASAVYLTIAVTVVTMVLLRSRAAVLLLAVEVGQGVIGFVQYYNGLPVPVVALHLLGAALAIAAAANLAFSYRHQAGKRVPIG